MKKTLLVYIFFICNLQVLAQETEGEQAPATIAEPPVVTTISNTKLQKPLGRVKSSTSVNNESSSFIPDPDNLDPLNPNRENLKEDEEPVLEDIKDVLNTVKKPKTKSELVEVAPPPVIETLTDSVVVEAPVEVQKIEKVEKTITKSTSLISDDPDFKLEKKFNEIFQTYNFNPTSDDIWSAATSKQTLREYIVQKGDTLWSISKILFADPNFWPKIWALNKQGILNPHFIYPNSKIYFYMGNEESAPTLSVGTPASTLLSRNDEAHAGASKAEIEVKNAAAEDEMPTEEVSKPTEEAGKGDTSSRKDIIIKKEKPGTFSQSGKIPRSLPVSRNARYFSQKKADEIRIDFGAFPVTDYTVNNDIYITDQPIKTEIMIQRSETVIYRCYEGRILRDIKFIGKLVEDYDIFEPLDNIKTNAGTMYAYRLYGKARPYQRTNIKISDCKSLLLTSLIFLPKDKIQTLRNRQISSTKNALVIGGPEVVNQKHFVPNQVAYVDFGAYAFEAGQEFKTMSHITDEINGNFKIIEKYGSFAVVLLTEINDLLEIGDQVILK